GNGRRPVPPACRLLSGPDARSVQRRVVLDAWRRILPSGGGAGSVREKGAAAARGRTPVRTVAPDTCAPRSRAARSSLFAAAPRRALRRSIRVLGTRRESGGYRTLA